MTTNNISRRILPLLLCLIFPLALVAGCGSYVPGEHDIIDMTKPANPEDPDEPGEEPTDPDEPAEPDTPEEVFFTIDDKPATDGNFIHGRDRLFRSARSRTRRSYDICQSGYRRRFVRISRAYYGQHIYA